MAAEPAPPGPGESALAPTSSGRIPFTIPSTGDAAETYYMVWGSLDGRTAPLIVLHGGPGAAHNYVLRISLLHKHHGIPVVLYDQIGCGQSSHHPEYKGERSDIWSPALFVAELDNLRAALGITSYSLLGQSWGGMLAVEYILAGKATGLQKLVLSNSLASMPLFMAGVQRLRDQLPADVQETLRRCEEEGRTDSPEYEAGMMVFYGRHVCRSAPMPDDMVASLVQAKEDGTVYEIMNGPSEFHVVGSIKDWSAIDRLHRITDAEVPGGVLVVNGAYDEAQDEANRPFFQLIRAPVKWRTFGLSSHTPWLEEPEAFRREVGGFLTE